MHELFLCLRYLRKRRIAFFGIAAVTLCVALLIVVTSLFEGFIAEYETHERRLWGDIALFPPWPIPDYGKLTAELAQVPGVAYCEALIETEALLYLARGDIRGVKLVATQPPKWETDQRFRAGLLLQGQTDTAAGFALSREADQTARQWLRNKLRRELRDSDMPIGAMLGIGLLGQPDELTDEYNRTEIIDKVFQRKSPYIIITSRRGFGSKSSSQINIEKVQRQCWPVDIVQTGLHDADTTCVYLPFDYLRDVLSTGGPHRAAADLQISVQPQYRAEKVLPKIWEKWRTFAAEELHWPTGAIDQTIIETTAQRRGMLTQEIRKQLGMMQILLGLICVVVALLIFVILFMIVMHKRRDIGIVRAVGASRSQVATLFLGYGAAIGVAGSAVGLALGVVATRNISTFDAFLTRLLGFKMWKSGVYLFSDIPSEVAWHAVGWILAAGIGAAVVGALLPAIRAARMQPVDTLRYE